MTWGHSVKLTAHLVLTLNFRLHETTIIRKKENYLPKLLPLVNFIKIRSQSLLKLGYYRLGLSTPKISIRYESYYESFCIVYILVVVYSVKFCTDPLTLCISSVKEPWRVIHKKILYFDMFSSNNKEKKHQFSTNSLQFRMTLYRI